MKTSLLRDEFVPIDLGTSVNEEKLKTLVETTAKAFGWEPWHPAGDEAIDALELNRVLPYRVGIFSKGNTVLYVPQSGFAVARQSFHHEGDSAISVCANTLLARLRYHTQIEKGEIPDGKDLCDLVAVLRNSLQQLSKNPPRDTTASIATYALSAITYQNLQENLVAALLNPRSVGCSVSRHDTDPSVERIAELLDTDRSLKEAGQGVGEPIPLRGNTATLRSSWSTVVLQDVPSGSKAQSARGLLTLTEFRLQSTWFAAHRCNEIACAYTASKKPHRDVLALRTSHLDFRRLHSQYEARLGADSPDDPTKMLKEIERSSDVAAELSSARESLDLALTRASFAVDRHSLMSRRMVEIFTLTFAAASVAALLLPLPITCAVIEQNPLQFAVWCALTLIGIFFILRQNR